MRKTPAPTPAPAESPEVMPAAVHGEPVVSAFRHLPLYGRTSDTYTVITRAPAPGPGRGDRYSVLRARFAPALGRWSIDTGYDVQAGLHWTEAAEAFTRRLAGRVS